VFANLTTRVCAALLGGLAAVAIVPATASAQLSTLGLHGWQVASSAQVGGHGARISQPRYATAGWLRVAPDDAGAVGTEVGALVQNHRCPNVFYSTNMKSCFGYMSQVGPDTIAQFAVPWWFRTTFRGPARARHEQLIINGVVGQADVWINGTRVASRKVLQGAYTRFVFDVTRLVRRGTNALALELAPNDPTKMFTLDNVDWTQIPPDNNTGIQFPIQLHTVQALGISDVHAVQHTARDLSRSELRLEAQLTNLTRTPQTGMVSAILTAPGGAQRRMTKTVTVAPGHTRTIALPVHIAHPRLWWPYAMGAQPLYRLRMSVRAPHGASDAASETFGIRTITTRLIGASPLAPQGSRQFLVNGRPFVFRGGGWSEDLFLRYSARDTANQIAMIKNLGLNGIRTEGKQMPDNFYEQFDRAGLLIDAGYQCCDAWQLQDSKLTTAHDYALLRRSARAIGVNLRNHPSILNFSWSDNQPTAKQEAVSVAGFRAADFQEPLIASAEYKSSPKLGPSGEKEGPYDWVPPSYWYDTTHYDPNDPSRTNVGGAWAFDSEAGAGHTVPTMDSIARFMSPFEQTQLWTNPDYNQYHANYEPDLPNPTTNSGYSFGTLHDLDAAISARYGPWSSLAGYVQEAQVQNYETQRAQFEAYIDHSTRRRAPSTGVVYWQLNKGWPTLLWDLYNHDLDQAGSYFGAKKANDALHVLYAYDSGAVAVDNLGAARASGLSVRARVYSLDGRLLHTSSAQNLSVPGQGVAGDVLRPVVPGATAPPAPAQTYFVQLLLSRHGVVVDRNVYWLSTQPDVVNWPKTIGMPQATMSQFASLRGLQSLGRASIGVSAHTHSARGPNGADTVTDVTITNLSKTPTVGFFLRADVRRGTSAGIPAAGDNQVLPVFWSDNDVTLWPGESQTLSATYRHTDLRGTAPVVSVSGWNRPALDVPAR
jgi:exo-1,4-beta-D-glucosaminidase